MPRKVQMLTRGMLVNVFDVDTGKKAIGSPVTIRRMGIGRIEAVDCDNSIRVFNLDDWRIEVL